MCREYNMPEVDIYAAESKFNAARTEYMTLMSTITTSCLGNDQMSSTCQKAASLNADMQTYLIEMSNSLPKNIENIAKQHEILSVSAQLDKDMNLLITEIATKKDSRIIAQMNYINMLPWFISSIAVCSIVLYQWNRQ